MNLIVVYLFKLEKRNTSTSYICLHLFVNNDIVITQHDWEEHNTHHDPGIAAKNGPFIIKKEMPDCSSSDDDEV